MVNEDYKEMITAHALSALDRNDADVLSKHLSECSECRTELSDWETTAASLALSADPVAPSPQVRERILGAIRQETNADSGARVLPFAAAPRNIWTSFGSLGAIAAVVLFAALIVSVVVLWRQNRATQAEVTRLASQLKSAQDELERSSEFVKLVSTPGARVTELAGTDQATGATAKLAYDKAGRAMLVANGLPRAPAGKEYQLWFIVGNRPPLPGKSFAPDDTGSRTLKDQVPPAAIDSAVFAITLEPAGGVTAPTGAIYLRSGL
jgi:anti-sigma-K factor RskA